MSEGKRRVDNIILCGLTGCGKTSVGKHLAYLCGLGFTDTDKMIEEKEKQCIINIFKSKGESYFRQKEKECIDNLTGIKKHVISVGSGAVEHSMETMKKLGYCIWLDVPVNLITQRFIQDQNLLAQKPLLVSSSEDQTNDPQSLKSKLTLKLEELLKKRLPYYNQADLHLQESFYTSETASRSIYEYIRDERIYC